MNDKITKIFIAPHNDDEALYGAFTIMTENPLVVVVSDSHIQQEQYPHITPELRRQESTNAMKMLKAEVRFMGVPDNGITDDMLLGQFEKIKKQYPNLKIVYAPMIERGNILHDMCGRIAGKVFDNVLHYSTYTKERPRAKGDIPVHGDPEALALKLKALQCYKSQINKTEDKIYFDEAMKHPEFFNSSAHKDIILDLKEQALKNLVDFKDVMDKLGVPFCLMDGTLLGAYRDRDFIRNDYDDSDVGIPESFQDWANEIYKYCKDAGFEGHKRFDHEGKFEGGSVERNGSHMDFFIIHKKGNDAYNLGRNFLPENKKSYMAYVYPRECFDKRQRMIFKGMSFLIPYNPEKFLTARYGDWKKPLTRLEGFDWLSQQQNPALKGNYEI